jgi:hypothetical protein
MFYRKLENVFFSHIMINNYKNYNKKKKNKNYKNS